MSTRCKHCGRKKPLLKITGCCRNWRDCERHWKPWLVIANYNQNARKMGWPSAHELLGLRAMKVLDNGLDRELKKLGLKAPNLTRVQRVQLRKKLGLRR